MWNKLFGKQKSVVDANTVCSLCVSWKCREHAFWCWCGCEPLIYIRHVSRSILMLLFVIHLFFRCTNWTTTDWMKCALVGIDGVVRVCNGSCGRRTWTQTHSTQLPKWIIIIILRSLFFLCCVCVCLRMYRMSILIKNPAEADFWRAHRRQWGRGNGTKDKSVLAHVTVAAKMNSNIIFYQYRRRVSLAHNMNSTEREWEREEKWS